MLKHLTWKLTANRTSTLRLLGIMLFAVSFLMPDADFGENGLVWSRKENGFSAFSMTPIFLVGLLGSVSDWKTALAGIALAAAWLANFTMLVRLPRLLAWIPIMVPWLFFMTFWLEWYPNGRSITGFVPFYVWSVGIGLFHASVYLRHQRQVTGAERAYDPS